MAALTETAFKSKWHFIFADNSNREVSEEDMRNFITDIADTFYNRVSGGALNTLWKDPCQVATTANITLSGEQTIDGVLTSSSRVLVKNQTTASQNGIYVSAAGAWTRATDTDSDAEIEGAAVGVTQGTTYGDTVWLQITDSVALGSSSIVWQQIGFGVASQNLQQVLTEGNSAGNLTIEDVADPVNANDATNKAWVLANAGGTVDSVDDLPNQEIEEVTSTSYVFTSADHLKIKKFTNVSGCTATIPVGLDTGWSTTVYRASGAGTLTLASSGTLESTDTTLGSEKTAATIVHMGSDVHVAVGALGNLGLTVGTINGQTKSSNGLVLAGSAIYAQTADASSPGLVSTGTQTIAGAKTFSSLATFSAGLTSPATVNVTATSGKGIHLTGNTLAAQNQWSIRIRDISEGDFGIYDETAGAYRMYFNSSGQVIINTAPTTSNSGNSILARNSTTGALELRSDVVVTSGSQTIGGTKTFSSTPVLSSAPSTSTSADILGRNTSTGAIERRTDITSGTYTPTGTAVSTVSSVTTYPCQYMRVGSVVTVSGRVDCTESATDSIGSFRITLPIASNFTNTNNYECAGTAYTSGNPTAAQIIADTSNDAAFFKWANANSLVRQFWFTFTYRII